MIVGIGVDLIEVERIQRALDEFGERFVRRILHPDENTRRQGSDAECSCSNNVSGESKGVNIQLSTKLPGTAQPPETLRWIEYVAGRFAAKEAVSKALHTGIGRVSFTDIVIRRGGDGQPVIDLYGPAREIAGNLGICSIFVSISHTRTHAVAMVVAER